MKVENNYYLYRHIRLDKNEPFYIGIGTKCKEFTNHKGEYTRAFNREGRNNYWKHIINKSEYIVEILLESDSYDFIKQKEIEFIKLYGRKNKRLGPLVNLTDGGDGNYGVELTKETRDKMSKSRIGLRKNGTKVYQYDLDGNFVKEWKSIAIAEDTLNFKGGISKCICDKNHTCGNFYWSKHFRETFINPIDEKNYINIYQYDLNGNFVKQWKSTKEAAEFYNRTPDAINKALNGVTVSSCGFLWDYELCKKNSYRMRYNYKKVEQLSINDESIRIYDSLRDVYNDIFSDREFKKVKDSILTALTGKCYTALGYKWKYVN